MFVNYYKAKGRFEEIHIDPESHSEAKDLQDIAAKCQCNEGAGDGVGSVYWDNKLRILVIKPHYGLVSLQLLKDGDSEVGLRNRPSAHTTNKEK